MPELTCVACPFGCRLIVGLSPDGLEVKDRGCQRGEEYALTELTDPRRILTSIVSVIDRDRYLPVKTMKPIPKGRLFDAMAVIKKTMVAPPVKAGRIVVRNIAGTGVDLVAAGTMD